MRFFLNEKDILSIKDIFVFVDNDFLGILFSDEEALTQISELFSNCFMVDPLIKFEFLRDIFLPTQRIIKEEFISNPQFFSPTENHPEVFKRVQGNAIYLSQIYSHKNTSAKPSIADLFLAGRLMNYADKSVLITGNKKDFPSCVFSTITVLNYEQEGDDSIKPFSILKFDTKKFKNCEIDLIRLQKEIINK